MKTPPKSYYKIGEVSAMLGVPPSTLRFWEDAFDELSPPRLSGKSGSRRKYRPEDVDVCRRIRHLLREKGYSLEYAKRELSGFTPKEQLHAPDKCKSAKGAIRLLSEASRRIDDPSAKIRVDFVLEWLKTQADDQN